MSLLVAIKDKDRIIFGSDRQASVGNNKSHDATKIWEVSELPGAICGAVGTARGSQVIQYNTIVDMNAFMEHPIDTEFVVNSIVPNIVLQLQAHGVCCTVKEENDATQTMIPCTFFFAFENRCWMIWHDLSVSELDNYLAIGSGSDIATGVLYATKEKNPFDRIAMSIHAAAESTLFVDDEIDMLATEYLEEDDPLVAKVLGFEKEYNEAQARKKEAQKKAKIAEEKAKAKAKEKAAKEKEKAKLAKEKEKAKKEATKKKSTTEKVVDKISEIE